MIKKILILSIFICFKIVVFSQEKKELDVRVNIIVNSLKKDSIFLDDLNNFYKFKKVENTFSVSSERVNIKYDVFKSLDGIIDSLYENSKINLSINDTCSSEINISSSLEKKMLGINCIFLFLVMKALCWLIFC